LDNSSISFAERDTSSGVDQLFLERWSPRAFQKHEIDHETLHRIMDAARWSPSCFNAQPWVFYTSTEHSFNDFLNLLVEGNQAWAKDVSVIGFIVAAKNFEHNGEANSFAGFDCGAAWLAMTLQARIEGLYTHGMGGIKKDEVETYLDLDLRQNEVVMGFTIGKLADLENLNDEQRANETPNGRKALSDIWVQR